MVQLPVAAMARAIGRAGAPARLSIDAGDYVCNQTLYTSLGLGANAGFIHVPRSRALRRPLRADRLDPRPTIDAMTAGVLAAIVICAAQTRNAALARALRGRA